MRQMNGDAVMPVTAEVLIGPLLAEVRLNISAEAQLAVRCETHATACMVRPLLKTGAQLGYPLALCAASPKASGCCFMQAVARCRLP